MQYRPLGKTGLKVSSIGYGCSGLWGEAWFSEQEAVRLVHTAVDLGVTLFDTGHSYNAGRAESRLGKALRGLDRSCLVLCSKCGTQVGRFGRLYKDFRPATLRANLEESLRKLATDYLDILLLHNPSMQDMSDDVIDLLCSLRHQGTIRHWGASTGGGGVRRILECGGQLVMFRLNLLCPQHWQRVEVARQYGAGVLIKSPMAHRLFAPDWWKPRSPRDLWYIVRILAHRRDEIRQARSLCWISGVEGWTGAEIALGYLLQSDHVSSAIIGTTRREHLEVNVKATERTLPETVSARLGLGK